MNAPTKADPSRLLELRAKIDAIDESVHRLLMQRAEVIDELIKVKGTARNGAAFRPGREADMMRRLADRHRGHLPLTAIEHLWREIISTFTALQAPFDVLVAAGADPVAMVEVARFYFGFSVPMMLQDTAADVVTAIEEGGDRLGILPIGTLDHPWWQGLRSAHVVARLPFFEAADRPAATPSLVVAPPLSDPVPPEITCFCVDGLKTMPAPADGVTILAEARYGTDRFSAIVASADPKADLTSLGDGLDIRPIGGYAAPFRPTV
ncbi:chorismate mutase [Aurantimonas sp. VKM B-3413]|uniref:chorismate mutase n=1 Tax=Aurantimonas sp. VKM B-3413 TaxID=2779401 RepID=UPI001E61FF6A|nr:chorismate mutase [Aurantimonas sp. VKM B-3413]MCB8837244.1 chorismate mutase [Aurantimonas sp. VKM B-3413]